MQKAASINMQEAYSGTQHSMHRGPKEAGAADRFYDRPYQPNFAYNGYTFFEAEMTSDQIKHYLEGYRNEKNRKDWGGEEIETTEGEEDGVY